MTTILFVVASLLTAGIVGLKRLPHFNKKLHEDLFTALSSSVPWVSISEFPELVGGSDQVLLSKISTIHDKTFFVKLAVDTEGVTWLLTDEELRTDISILSEIKDSLEYHGLCTTGPVRHRGKILPCVQIRELGTH